MTKLKETPLTYHPHEWVEYSAAFSRIMSIVGLHDIADACFKRDLRNGLLRSAYVDIWPDDVPLMPLSPSDWQQLHAPLNPEAGCFVRRADLDRWYPDPATPTMAVAHQSGEAQPQRRRGPILKHEWLAICGEIARRCINPETRFLEIPKSERKLAEDMLAWCQEKYEQEPTESEMRVAVKAMCAALRPAEK